MEVPLLYNLLQNSFWYPQPLNTYSSFNIPCIEHCFIKAAQNPAVVNLMPLLFKKRYCTSSFWCRFIYLITIQYMISGIGIFLSVSGILIQLVSLSQQKSVPFNKSIFPFAIPVWISITLITRRSSGKRYSFPSNCSSFPSSPLISFLTGYAFFKKCADGISK